MDMNYIIEKAIKHYKLPIPLLPELYIYYIDLYEPILGTKTIVERAIEEIGDGNEKDYYEKLHEQKNAIITTIQDSDAYKEFNDSNNPKFFLSKGTPEYCQTSKRFRFTKYTDVYQPSNDEKFFVSVDMAKANYQILKKYNDDVVLSTTSYEELVRKFSNSEYLIGSKYIRQIIFGQLNPKRQNLMQKYFTGLILETLIDEKVMPEDSIRVYTSDELVFNADGYISPEKQNEIKNLIAEKFGFEMHVDSFKLHRIWQNAYAKELDTGKISFKGASQIYFPQIYKKYMGQPILKKDLAFNFEGQIAYFAKTIDGEEI